MEIIQNARKANCVDSVAQAAYIHTDSPDSLKVTLLWES